jgi:hypothetical protein
MLEDEPQAHSGVCLDYHLIIADLSYILNSPLGSDEPELTVAIALVFAYYEVP